MAKLTISDIAKIAGVSTATVSHVLNDKIKGNMSDKTCNRVKKVIEQTGYTKDSISSAMRTGVTKIIGLILPTNANLYYAQLAEKIELTLFQAGFLTYLCSTKYSIKIEKNYIKTLLQHKVSSILLCSKGLTGEEINSLNKINPMTNIILIDEQIANFKGSIIIADDVYGGEIGIQYLFDNAHRDVVIIAGPKNLMSTHNRLKGIKRKYKEEDLVFDDSNLVYGDYQINKSRELVLQLLKENRKFSAIFALNDMMAIGAILALNDKSLRVPEDISVLGYDNINLSEFFYPKISTVEIPINIIAEKSRNLVLHPEKNKAGSIDLIKPRLIIRESVMYRYH